MVNKLYRMHAWDGNVTEVKRKERTIKKGEKKCGKEEIMKFGSEANRFVLNDCCETYIIIASRK